MNKVEKTIYGWMEYCGCIECEKARYSCTKCGKGFKVHSDIYCVDDGKEHWCTECYKAVESERNE